MGAVGGSRHYTGGTLGHEAGWACPSCGAENQGPIAQGCTQCGAGRPGRHIGTEAPPAPPRPPAPEPAPAPDPPEARQGDVATYWADTHPEATIEDAYRAGYLDGVQASRAAARRRPEPTLPPADKITRTIVAALEYFGDQVLRAAPHEVESGEWCSVEEVGAIIAQLTSTGEVVHG